MTTTAAKPKGSRKTTLSGYFMAIGTVAFAIGYFTDGDPSTHADLSGAFEGFGVVLGGLGSFLNGLWSRDDDVSSEQAAAAKS